MAMTSQQLPASQEKFESRHSWQGSAILGYGAALAFIGALGLAPIPAFAQHGGGGGGGSHGGGGGGGASHGSFGGGGSAPASSSGGGSHASAGNSSSGSGSGGHW